METRTECCGWSSWGELAGMGRGGRAATWPDTPEQSRVVIVEGGTGDRCATSACAGASRNARVGLDEVIRIEFDAHVLHLRDGTALPYDCLVFAAGCP